MHCEHVYVCRQCLGVTKQDGGRELVGLCERESVCVCMSVSMQRSSALREARYSHQQQRPAGNKKNFKRTGQECRMRK